MRVVFCRDVLDDSTQWSRIDRIFDFFENGRHVLDIEDIDEVLESAWLDSEDSRTSRRNRELLEKCLTDAEYSANRASLAHRSTIAVDCQTDDKNGHRLRPDDARSCLGRPVYLVIEDTESDGAFVKGLIRAYGRSALDCALDKDWLELRRGGGSKVRAELEQLLAKNIPGPRRIAALIDSDRLFPGQALARAKEDIISWCQDRRITIHVLHKREIENYIPVDGLSEPSEVPAERVPHTRHAARRRAYLSLTQEQRDHYDMKRGFKRGQHGEAAIPAEQNKLFESVSQARLSNLCGGFGDNVWKRFEQCEYQPSDFEIICTTCPDELPGFLDKIEVLL